ncbi:MAG TPA: glycogen synthase [Thermoanaerobaculia bacterium]|nr:glycogen synthase [Thermoanaerobaculia bacterium]HUM29685.1 glycogen synthase [Thermoanaerobaculia bacterium]HXK66986.1 glycogen synthase [Thermoanaerobaculia bacterium]
MRVYMAASECSPFAKVGGLADVVFSLSRALADQGVSTTVFLPNYGGVERDRLILESWEDGGPIPDEGGGHQWNVHLKNTKATFCLLDLPPWFSRPGIYDDPATGEGYPDNGERFLAFSHAVASIIGKAAGERDVVHLHDNHTGPVAGYLRQASCPGRIVFHIHNLGYQGNFEADLFARSGLPESWMWAEGPAEFYGKFSFMKLGISLADEVVTVSPRYAEEILSGPEFGCGMEGLLNSRGTHFRGILNGIDPVEWDPASDPLIPHPYDPGRMEGKAANKKALREAFCLPTPRTDTPMVGMITRLAEQKGIGLVIDAMKELMSLPLQLVILGEGRLSYHQALQSAAAKNRRRFGLRLGYDNSLAHLIEAGSNLFLMPSLYEPCGLNQMYSLRYGTLPIVRRVGGLFDTVRPVTEDGKDGWGFTFDEAHPDALLEAVREAIFTYRRKKIWASAVQRAMALDFTWAASARKFLELYRGMA